MLHGSFKRLRQVNLRIVHDADCRKGDDTHAIYRIIGAQPGMCAAAAGASARVSVLVRLASNTKVASVEPQQEIHDEHRAKRARVDTD